jgi:regulatory protein
MKSERKYSLLEAKARLEALCAYQERCSYELIKKMNLWFIDREDQDRLLAELISSNFLNEERFAEAFASGRMRIKRWGKIKIRVELKKKMISNYSIDKALKGIDLDEYWANLIHLAERKWDLSNENDLFKKKVKLYLFLNSKGYEADLIKDAVEEIYNRNESSKS